MFTKVDTVLIAKAVTAATSISAMAKGDLALFDENGKILTAATAATANKVRFGVAGENINYTAPNGTAATTRNVEYSNWIQKESRPTEVMGAYAAPVQEKIEIDLTGATIVAGNRYVLRIVYKDLYEAPGQFTHTYEVVAEDATAASVGNALLKRINKHANRRVSATFAGNKLTLTAMEKDDNEGKNSLNEYSVVSMEATLYFTIPGALLSNIPENVPGVTITRTQGNPGKGYWKQVRDLEVRALGYKGHVFTDAYPVIEPARNVTEGAQYNYMIVENDNLYLSPDNQYIKTTPLRTEIFCEAALTNFEKIFKSFVTGAEVK